MRILRLVEALRCLIPVSANALRSELDLILVLSNNLAQSEVSDFDFSIVEDDVLRFKVVVNDFLLFIVVQVLDA